MMHLVGEQMTAGYGSANVIENCTISVNRGEVAAIVGPNGAGKSTAMKALIGMLELSSGRVCFNGADISEESPQSRIALGMAFVPQNQNIFTSMSVEENLEMGAFLRRDNFKRTMNEVYSIFPVLREKRRQLAGELSGGQRQQVALGRALMTEPEVLMLDEPTAGVAPVVMDEIFRRIVEIASTGVSVLMVEQNARWALEVADVGYVMVQGTNRYTDSGRALLSNREVRKTFLGG